MSVYRYIILSFLVFPMALYASPHPDFNPDVSTWVENKIPPHEPWVERMNWMYSVKKASIDWAVSLVDGKVMAKTIEHTLSFPIPKDLPQLAVPAPYKKVGHTYKVNDGWFVAFYGDRDGELWWYSNDGKSSYKIVRSYVRYFLAGDDAVYVLDGTYFQKSPSIGSLQKIVKGSDGEWKLALLVPIYGVPALGKILSDNSIIILSPPAGLFLLTERYEAKPILGVDDIYDVYANSIVSVNNDQYIYIGARQYVIEVNLKTKKVRYLVPSKEFIEYHIDEINMPGYIEKLKKERK